MTRFSFVLFSMLMLTMLGGCAGSGKAEEFAVAHVESLYPEHNVVGLSCVGTDSDGDGYVSCTVTMKAGDGPIERLDLQCARALGFTRQAGCKTTMPNISGGPASL